MVYTLRHFRTKEMYEYLNHRQHVEFSFWFKLWKIEKKRYETILFLGTKGPYINYVGRGPRGFYKFVKKISVAQENIDLIIL